MCYKKNKGVKNDREKLQRNVTVELDMMQQLYVECDVESKHVKDSYNIVEEILSTS